MKGPQQFPIMSFIPSLFMLFLTVASPASAGFFSSSVDTPAHDPFPTEYGVDVTTPVHNYIDAKKYPYFAERYKRNLQGCYEKYSRAQCDVTERGRLAMNKDQPQNQHNYTEIGFKKMVAPDSVWEPLIQFYNSNKHLSKPEKWPAGNTYVNHWDSPTMMVSFEDRQLRGGQTVKQALWAAMRPVLEEWTGKKVEPTSLYGIRIYGPGAVLATHVDRLPLVSSAIIQVDQDVDEPWPIEVYSHAGRAYNVTMRPRDMVLYESHTVLHGRPFPLVGSRYANVFVHYKPVDHDLENEADKQRRLQEASAHHEHLHEHKHTHTHTHGEATEEEEEEEEEEEGVRRFLPNFEFFTNDIFQSKKVRDALGGGVDEHGGHEQSNLDPAARRRIMQEYRHETGSDIMEGDPDYDHRRHHRSLGGSSSNGSTGGKGIGRGASQPNSSGASNGEVIDSKYPQGMSEEEVLHVAASRGDIKTLERLLSERERRTHDVSSLLHSVDDNDWQAIHEAIRSGKTEAVKFLVDMGADISSAVVNGGSSLWLARRFLSPDHPVISYLISIGAPETL